MEKNNNLVKAINKNVRSSPRKISLVLDHIRGKKVDKVLRDLDFIRKRISKDVSKTVKSAIANAEKLAVLGGSSTGALFSVEATHTTAFGPVKWRNGNGSNGQIQFAQWDKSSL